jgi:hydrogenase maturation protein HypF
MAFAGLHIEIRGTVQGVGYRPWVYQLAQRIGVAGRVWNHSRGVSIDAHGPAEALEELVSALRSDGPPAARVTSVVATPIEPAAVTTFIIDESVPSGAVQVAIPADLATCEDCLSELLDPEDRRHRYPFINCTNCGPRYSIVEGAPYDRAKTSMAPFRMCDECRREYDSPDDRRFHAQPNACGKCGPRILAMSPRRQELATSDPIRFAARALRAGLIVAIKGLGGFHLACDATSPRAVARLRSRKRRDTKPFAVMVRDLDEAERLAELTDAERTLLLSIERPIVLATARDQSDLPLIGLFLPYTPLHHLLLHDADVPLVMTSGNVCDEPMVTTNDEAFAQLAEIADVFLIHDRDIVTRVDDSIVRVIDGAPMLLRRARGFVPRAIETAREFAEPILACGAHLKNTFCVATGNSAFVGPHIGDLENVATLHAYEQAIERMKEFVGVSPKVVAHDLHPDYFSTRYALALEGVQTIAVQHHHAHIVSVMAEHGLEGPVLGIAYDGTGFGTDNTSWGGEFLIAHYDRFERFATFRPVALAGGDQAIRNPWRIALALLDEAFHGEPPLQDLPLFDAIGTVEVEAVRRMIERNFNTPAARGVGRYFDAIGALVLNMPVSRYEGEVAFRLNMIADRTARGRYPVVIHESVTPWELDFRPVIRSLVEDMRTGSSPATISARFHNTLAAATIEIARAALDARGPMPVVLSGGCFQNARLTEAVAAELHPFVNRRVPPGDGGIALGQAFVAAARMRAAAAAPQEVPVCV